MRMRRSKGEGPVRRDICEWPLKRSAERICRLWQHSTATVTWRGRRTRSRVIATTTAMVILVTTTTRVIMCLSRCSQRDTGYKILQSMQVSFCLANIKEKMGTMQGHRDAVLKMS